MRAQCDRQADGAVEAGSHQRVAVLYIGIEAEAQSSDSPSPEPNAIARRPFLTTRTGTLIRR
jgi:hypothetical protein